jgi:hypothetical protein
MPSRGLPFLVTRAEGTEGFPALVREMMWRANFSYEPEYFLYSVEIGHRLVETHACVLLHPHLMEGPPKRSHHFSGVGSSPESAIQICAYNAITCLHRKYSELNSSYTFAYFPFHVQSSTNAVLYPHPEHEDDLHSIRMSELTRALDIAFLCYASELNSSHRRLVILMARLENLHMRNRIPYIETGAPQHVRPSDLLPTRHLHTTIRGVQYAPLPHFNRHMPFAELRQVMGDPSSLTHPEAPGDNGHPTFYWGHTAFSRRRFARVPYQHEGGGYT